MADDSNKTPTNAADIPGPIKEKLIAAAATLAGIPKAEIDLQKAVYILAPYTEKMAGKFAGDAAQRTIKDIVTGNATPKAITQTAALLLSAAENALAQEKQEDNPKSIVQTAGRIQATADDIKKRWAAVDWENWDREKTIEMLAPLIQPMLENLNNSITQIGETLLASTRNATTLFQSETGRRLRQILAYIADNADALAGQLEEMEQLEPYIEKELRKPEYKGLTLEQLSDAPATDENGNPTEYALLYEKAIFAAVEARDKDLAQAPNIAAVRADSVEYPVDKVNTKIWNLLEDDTQGQIKVAMESTQDKKKGRMLNLLYSINFDSLEDEIKVSKRLTPFDKRVYIAAATLYNIQKNRGVEDIVITLTQIHYAMGNSTNPNEKQLQKIYESISKMNSAHITVDNSQEADAYNYPRFVYDGKLLPFERMTALVNGRLNEAAIHLFREPPVMTFAKQRNQVTTIDIKVLQSPFSKTDGNLLIEDYLIERISREKSNYKKRLDAYKRDMRKPEEKRKGLKKPEPMLKILFETLYKETGLKGKQTERAPKKIQGYLEHQKQEGFITGYTIKKDAAIIFFKG